MATTKLTITLPDEQLAEIRALVEAGRSPNVSAFVKHAVDVSLSDMAGWKEMLDDALRQTGGPLTKSERDWVDSLITPPKPGSAKLSRKRKAA
jgi:Arc/MetJ-type ribon-helix-helix transcriptional regulator